MPHPISPSRRAFDRGILFGRHTLFFEPDRGGGSGNNPPTDDRQNLQGLLQRHQGDALAVVSTLLAENHSLRDERRQLRSQLPPQGAVVLNEQQAGQWTAYQQLGTVEALTQERTTAQTTQTELTGLRRESLLNKVEGASGYKASVLGRLADDKIGFEIREADGKKSVIVKDGDKETPLAEYAQAKWADFLPALTAASAQGQAQQQPAGTSFVPQNAGGAAPGGDVATNFLKQAQAARDAAPNPLAPQKTA